MTSDPNHPSDSTDELSWSFREVLSRPHRLDLVWLLLPVTLALGGFGLLPLRSWDYWWHITMGRLINYWGAIPAANHYLYTLPAEAASIDQPWLAQVGLYGAHFHGSVYLALIVRNFAAAAAVGWLGWTAMRRADSVVWGSLLTLTALPFLFAFIEVRPTLFAWPLFCALLWLGSRILEGNSSRWWLAAFPAVSALWANLHGSFALAALLCGLFGTAATLRERHRASEFDWQIPATWFGTTVATAFAAAANPHGFGIFGYLYDVATDPVVQSTVTEWLPTTLSNPSGLGIFFYVVGLAGTGVLLGRRYRVEPIDALLFGVFGLMAVLQARALLWFGFILPLTLSRPLRGGGTADSETAAPHPFMQRVHTLAALVLVGGALLVQPTWKWRVDWAADSPTFDVRERPPMKGVVPSETPFEATEVVGRFTRTPRIFHDHRYAGFLMYHLTDTNPRRMVFVDHRIELPPQRVWNEYYEVIRSSENWSEVLDKHDVEAAVLSAKHQLPLAERLDESSDWAVLMETDDWFLFVRADRRTGGA